ncbi:hypothetical protein BKH41_03715 [Helicobacter sp. 12S02232-10]|uniref:hypothetical protein n=1 Tax=Helicobacter sp. 12S02232-10 TaxID=1476197 RepID=UPI000BA6D25C|nr:hypothetical protein [Helicobacter sp. 12S02232-10]PAF49199.1 hypothetical protein BKH41_03715 [Helicobacter sp. 12S02232-10]
MKTISKHLDFFKKISPIIKISCPLRNLRVIPEYDVKAVKDFAKRLKELGEDIECDFFESQDMYIIYIQNDKFLKHSKAINKISAENYKNYPKATMPILCSCSDFRSPSDKKNYFLEFEINNNYYIDDNSMEYKAMPLKIQLHYQNFGKKIKNPKFMTIGG